MVTVTLEGGMRFIGRGEDGHDTAMDAHPKNGGADSAARPISVLLSSLGGCSGMDVISILRKMQAEPEGLHIEIDGERADELPRPFTKIHLTYVVTGDVPEEKLKRAIDLSLERYCPVAASLAGVAKITSDYRIEPGS
jgi:putative redox protein